MHLSEERTLKDLREEQALSAAKRRNVAQLLFKVARQTNERAMAGLRLRLELPELRPAHAVLFPHIDLEGTRLTTLAQRVGISKQAVSQLVEELVQMDALERVPDPDDGRAKLIKFCPGALMQGLAHLKDVEQELEAVVGPEGFAQLHALLLALHDHFDESSEGGAEG